MNLARGLLAWLVLPVLLLASPAAESADAAGSGSFTPVGPLTIPRFGPIAARLPDGRVMVAGGMTPAPFQSVAVRSTDTFDPSTNSFTAGPALQSPRAFAAAARLEDGRILIAGGYDGTSVLSSSEIFDPHTNTSISGPDLGTPRHRPVAAPLPDGRVLIAGGFNGSTPLASAEVYDPQTNTFSPTSSMSTPHADAAASPLPDGRVLVAGGAGTGATSYPNDYLSTTELYDPSTDQFLGGPTMAYGVRGTTAAPLPDGRILLAGGFFEGPGAAIDAGVFLPGPGPFTSSGIGQLNLQCGVGGGSADSASAPLSDGRVLVAGGGYGGRCSGGEISDAKVFAATNSFKVRLKRSKLLVRVASTGTVAIHGIASRVRRAAAVIARKKFTIRSRSATGGPGTIKVPLALSKRARRVAKANRLKLKMHIAFTPEGGLIRSRVVTLKPRP